MMQSSRTLLDHRGNPVRRSTLRQEVSGATLGGVRSPLSGRPGDGLDPERLAHILRAADEGEHERYLELAEIIEERDSHYVGVLGTRKRQVSQIDITVEAGGDEDQRAEDIAEEVRTWLKRDELQEELFDILDATGKGYSFTEIIWDASMGQFEPQRLEYRDPRWFAWDRRDLNTPMMLDKHGQKEPLPGFKFIFARMKAKSGIAPRSGIARCAMWNYLFKKFTERDWAIFTQTFAQPVRVGKYQSGASEDDRRTLFQAVANIAGDMAAIIPESMMIEFVEAANVGSSHQLYKERADWLDQQTSKAVLGQTTTTDAISGGHAVSQEHRLVQEDIERADAKQLSATLNRDLVRPWVALNHGADAPMPRLVIARPEAEDVEKTIDMVAKLVPLGFQVSQKAIADKLGLPEPAEGDKILSQTPPSGPALDPNNPTSTDSEFKRHLNGRVGLARGIALQMQEGASAANSAPLSPIEDITDQMAETLDPEVGVWLEQIEEMMAAASSLEELREMLLSALPEMDRSAMTEKLATALIATHLGGRVAVENDSG